MPEDFEQEPDEQEVTQYSSYINEVCPHCHQKRSLEKGLLYCKRCNNADFPTPATT
jgi:hypothetical protein